MSKVSTVAKITKVYKPTKMDKTNYVAMSQDWMIRVSMHDEMIEMEKKLKEKVDMCEENLENYRILFEYYSNKTATKWGTQNKADKKDIKKKEKNEAKIKEHEVKYAKAKQEFDTMEETMDKNYECAERIRKELFKYRQNPFLLVLVQK